MAGRQLINYASLELVLGLLIVCIVSTYSELPPSCSSDIYCYGDLLKTIQLADIYSDSKTFVDMKLILSPETTLADFETLMSKSKNQPSRTEVENFVNTHFVEGDELDTWSPPDYTPSPNFINKIKDEKLKKFAKDVVAIWPTLGRIVIKDVDNNPDYYSFIYIPNGFVIPGGRFREIYYWDSYWIVKGLLISEMEDTVRGVIENFLYLVKKLGHVPNGSRVYYTQRSQPPLLTLMVKEYIDQTNNLQWLKENIATIEKELLFWQNNRTVTVRKNSDEYTLLQYRAESLGPRPESYQEDYTAAQLIAESDRERFYTDLKSAAESGWDFSSRWFFKKDSSQTNLTLEDIHTTNIVPVDLNAIYANACKILGNFYKMIGDSRNSRIWLTTSAKFVDAIEHVLWDHSDGIWHDYDLKNGIHRKGFYPSNIFPLWLKTFPADISETYYVNRVLNYIQKVKLDTFVGGIPTSLTETGQQWDLPNAWAPLQAAVIFGLYESKSEKAQKMAVEFAQTWIRANYIGYKKSCEMFEKYDANVLGQYGGGGEYVVQAGFGWTNGFAIQLFNEFGGVITAGDN